MPTRYPIPASGLTARAAAHWEPRGGEGLNSKGRGFEARATSTVSDHPSLSHRVQTDREPGPLRQGSWAPEGYSSIPGRTEESLSCIGKCSGGKIPSCRGGGHWTRSQLTAHAGEGVQRADPSLD